MRTVADLEMQMNAVERIKYYTNIENEAYDGMELKQALNWNQFSVSNKLSEILTYLC